MADWQRQVADGSVSAAVIDAYRRNTQALVQTAKSHGITELGQLDPALIYLWMHSRKRGAPGEPVNVNTRFARRSAARAFLMTAQCLGYGNSAPWSCPS